VSVEGFTERMENGLECVVVPGGEKFPGDDVRISDIPSGMDCFVVIRVAVIDVGSRVGHAAFHTTWSRALTFRARGGSFYSTDSRSSSASNFSRAELTFERTASSVTPLMSAHWATV
jgi:hypothetical protein